MQPHVIELRRRADTPPRFFEVNEMPPGFSPQITYGLPSSRGMVCSTSKAGGFKWIAFRPVLELGSIRQPCPSLTSSHRSVRISLRRAPVNMSRRMAAITQGEQLLSCSASRKASPKPRQLCLAQETLPPSLAILLDMPAGVGAIGSHSMLLGPSEELGEQCEYVRWLDRACQ